MALGVPILKHIRVLRNVNQIFICKITTIKTVLLSSRRKVLAQFSFWDVIWAKEISL